MRKLILPTLAAAGLALVLATGAWAEPSPLEPAQPAGPNAQAIADIYWVVFGVALGLFALVLAGLGLAVARGWDRAALLPGRRAAAAVEPGPADGRRIAFLAAIPVIGMVVVAVAVFAKLGDARDAPAPLNGAGHVEVAVKGQQGGWTYTYPGGPSASDELRVPTGALVTLTITSADVQHSFWVPQLAGQVRVFPGEERTLRFRADRDGTYLGRSTVPSGAGYEQLGITVHALPRADFDAWLASAGKAGS